MTDTSKIGQSLRAFREKQGLTQQELARQIAVSSQAVSAWERGLSVPDLENVLRLADCFRVSLDALLRQPEIPLYVGIDGGGTKTEFVLLDGSGAVLDTVLREGSNPNDRGLEACIRVLTEGLEQLLRGRVPRAVFAGIAGSSQAQYRKAVSQALRERFGAPMAVNSDAENLLSMGDCPESTMAVICGTGSCVYTRRDGRSIRTGGWGYLLDMAGSAYDIGRDALRAALAAEDGLAAPGPLADRVRKKLGGSPFSQIARIYGGGRAYISSFAPLVTELAQQEDPQALEILRANARHVAALITQACCRHGEPSQLLGGGSLLSCELYRAMVEAQAGRQIHVPQLPPVYGACIEALRMDGAAPTDDFKQTFTATYRR